MLAELHQLLRLVAALSVGVVVGSGLAAYRYQWARGFLPLQRATLVRVHYGLALAFLAAMVSHYALAPQVHIAQQACTLAHAAALPVGFSIRLSRKNLDLAIEAKIALVVSGGALLVVGHGLVKDGGDDHWESRARWESVVVVAARGDLERRSCQGIRLGAYPRPPRQQDLATGAGDTVWPARHRTLDELRPADLLRPTPDPGLPSPAPGAGARTPPVRTS